MSFERYIELLQILITMTDPANADEMLNTRNILKNLMELAGSSHMADALTLRAMNEGYMCLEGLLRSRKDFAGKPGDYAGNKAKRQRLGMILMPHC